MRELFDIINGTLLGDANIRSRNGKYPCYKLTAKDKNFLKWFQTLLDKYKIKTWIVQDNKISNVHSLGIYINTCPFPGLKYLEKRWYQKRNDSIIKIFPKDLELNPTVLLHWYLGDGSFPRRKNDKNRVSPVVLATNNFLKEDIDFLILKLKELNLNFYKVRYRSGFTGKSCGYALWSKVQDGTPYRFFKLIGLECPIEISNCITGNKGPGANTHYFKNKWPTDEDWIKILSNVEGIDKIIKEKRLELNIQRNEINKKLGTGDDYLRKIEYGVRFPSVENFRKILQILNLNSDHILSEFNR